MDVIAYLWTFWVDRQSAENGKMIYMKDCAGCHSMLEMDIVSRGF